VLLANALERLLAHYREVFTLRNLEHVFVDQIAARMGRRTNAGYKLWYRAMAALKQEQEGLPRARQSPLRQSRTRATRASHNVHPALG
jgi:DNA-directed RNA polymerase specialized sigma24 family protein